MSCGVFLVLALGLERDFSDKWQIIGRNNPIYINGSRYKRSSYLIAVLIPASHTLASFLSRLCNFCFAQIRV